VNPFFANDLVPCQAPPLNFPVDQGRDAISISFVSFFDISS